MPTSPWSGSGCSEPFGTTADSMHPLSRGTSDVQEVPPLARHLSSATTFHAATAGSMVHVIEDDAKCALAPLEDNQDRRSAARAAARSRERTLRFDGSSVLVSCEPSSTLPLDLVSLEVVVHRGVLVTLPSAWWRKV